MIKRLLTLLVTAGFVFSLMGGTALAFNKEKIIDDALFTATGSMSKSQIQTWLNNKAGFLKNWKDNVDHYADLNYSGAPKKRCKVHKATGMTAAEIIHEAATNWRPQYRTPEVVNGALQCGTWKTWANKNLKTISPRVLLATLEKEQSLISKTGSYSKQSSKYLNPQCNYPCSNEYALAWAMGYGFPDSGNRNHRYKGFYNQVNQGAWQLRFNFERSGGNTSWDGVGYISYTGPMTSGTHKRCSSCSAIKFDGYYTIDGKSTKMKNRATASLYWYTPHFHGNEVFVTVYERWFGAVHVGSYEAKFMSKTGKLSWTGGRLVKASFKMKNVGSKPWYDNSSAPSGTAPVVVAVSNPVSRLSKFRANWPTPKRPTLNLTKVFKNDGSTAADNQHKVKVGEIGKYEFLMTIPADLEPKEYKEHFKLIRGGAPSPTIDGSEVSIIMNVKKTNVTAVKHSQKDMSINPVAPGDSVAGWFKFKNTGNTAWYDYDDAPNGIHPVVLASTNPINRVSAFSNSWGPPGRPTLYFDRVLESDGTTLATNQTHVKPGQVAKYRFFFDAPNNMDEGTYQEWFQLILGGAKNAQIKPKVWTKVIVED